jgi:hypothetical protein
VLKLAATNGGLFVLEDINVVNRVGNRGGCLNSEFGAVLPRNRVRFADCIALASGAMAAEGGAIYTTGTTEIEDSVFEDTLADGATEEGASGGAILFSRSATGQR